jgi:hypothetical protein
MLTTFARSLRRQGDIPFDQAFANAVDDVARLLPGPGPGFVVRYDPADPSWIEVDGCRCDITTHFVDTPSAKVGYDAKELWVLASSCLERQGDPGPYPNRWPIPAARIPEIAAWVRKVRAEPTPAGLDGSAAD